MTSPATAASRSRTPAPSRLAGLGHDVDGTPLPDARRRLQPLVTDSDGRWGWWGPLAVTAVAGVLRFWNLGRPDNVLFDETYYAKDAYSLLLHGYVRESVDRADARIARGDVDRLFTDSADFYVHPDVGKWLIAAGEWLFGMDSFGWRAAAAAAGTLMVLVLARLVRRVTGSTLLGCVAGLLLAVDGLHFVMSRLALLDIFLALFVLCAVACLVADRDWGRVRLAARGPGGRSGAERIGPVRGLLVRPWRLAAGVCFGLACGTKWSAVFFLAAFGLLTWAWDSSARHAIGVRRPVLTSAVVDAVPAFISLVVVAAAVYLLTWLPWLAHAERFEEALGSDWGAYLETDARGGAEVAQSLRSLWHFHGEVWGFHTGEGLRDETHPYQSDAAGWLVINRPVGVDANVDIPAGRHGCPGPPSGDDCIEQILAIGTPLLWWAGVVALVVAAGLWVGARDWRFGLALVGVLAGWLPWLLFSDRPIFFFYAVTFVPFTVLAVTLVLGRVLGPVDAPPRRRRSRAVAAGAFVALVVANFAFLHPVLTDGLLTNEDWLERIWFTRWI